MRGIYFLILIIVVFPSCLPLLGSNTPISNSPYQPAIEYYANGQMMFKGQYYHGYRHGTWIDWNGSGDTVSILNYNYGDLEGPFKIWKLDKKYEENADSDYARDFGKVVTIVGSYSNGVLDGNYAVYYSSNTIKRAGRYNKGRLDGRWTEIAPSGDTLSIINYSLGQKKGPFSVWNFIATDISGKDIKVQEKIKHQGVFKFNQLIGNYVESYHDGTVRCSGGYFEGVRQGDWFWYSPKGIIKATAVFKMGEIVEFEEY